MKEYYEILGLDEDATLEEVNDAYTRLRFLLFKEREAEKINRKVYAEKLNQLTQARDNIILAAEEKAAEAARAVEVDKSLKDVDIEDIDDELEEPEEEVHETEAKSGNGFKVATGVLAVALAATLAIVGLRGCTKDYSKTGADLTSSKAAVTETIGDKPEDDETIIVEDTTTEARSIKDVLEDQTVETTAEADEEVQEDYENEQYVVDLGNVLDDTLVRARAQELVDQMNAAGIVNPETTVPYTVDQIFALIKYANGVYTPQTMEEIDVLHLNLLNLMISPLNTDPYLYHVVFASGNDDFNSLLDSNPATATFGEAFAAYGENGVYPLVQWFEQKRMEIYSSTDREEVNRIYREVGQVMADLMKGNGCTITLYDGKEAKEGIEYHFTSEQVLAHHSSAMIITTEFQLIMANHYEIRDVNDQVIDEVSQTWEVYNKLNSDGVDENGQPIINPDIVTYDEMNAWVNNGCDYEWAIDSVLIDGQTFGQRIQGDMEGMAQNNYAMQHGGSLSK